MSGPPLWEAASLPSGVAVRAASRVAAVAVAVAALVALVGGPSSALSVLVGGLVVLAVLWASARVLIAGARRSSPGAALALAIGIYLVAVVGLFLLAVAGRGRAGDGEVLRAAGVAAGALVVVVAWTAGLVAAHVRHDRPGRGRRGAHR